MSSTWKRRLACRWECAPFVDGPVGRPVIRGERTGAQGGYSCLGRIALLLYDSPARPTSVAVPPFR